ncbi:MAG: SUMF1/EgtB/PvdO family nonheme iron enzyme [Paludibacteraceae bacterium]|nr:SUMF1/EgtB/PvdO family nonheme iron enzyme [Paludibacteraceae bacterium]
MKKLILTIAALAAFSVSQAQETKKFMVVNLSTGIQKTIPVDEIADVEFQDMELNPALKTFEVNGVKFIMRKVEKGSFYMQTMEEDASKKVTLTKDFWMAETVVTQELYKAVTGESFPSYWQSWQKRDRYPVELTFPQTVAFISKLNELTGKNFRLPTEAEWEYAARGGKYHTPALYSGSIDIQRVAWYNDNREQASTDEHVFPYVATREPNELGIYDMSGLIWEWTSDYADLHHFNANSLPYGTDPVNPNAGDPYFIVRGGARYLDASECTVLYRYYMPNEQPDYDFESSVGVRLVLTAE